MLTLESPRAGIRSGEYYRLTEMATRIVSDEASQSELFEILAAPLGNETTLDLPTATITATVDATPNPTQQWALTLDG